MTLVEVGITFSASFKATVASVGTRPGILTLGRLWVAAFFVIASQPYLFENANYIKFSAKTKMLLL